MKRYVWLGDSKLGGSVFWDKKNERCVRLSKNDSYKVNNKRKSTFIMIIISFTILFRTLLKSYFNIGLLEDNFLGANIFFFTTVFTLIFIYLINLSFFGRSKDYEETTLEDGVYAIRSTGYLKNPLIFMLVNKRLKILISFFIILFLIFGIFQLYPNLAQYIKIIKICLMALFFMIPSYT